ncbi:MAG: BadF/BadG/BcrA/BcrD ATPase family protein [Deltaproteobacteria bacterium]
MISLIARGAEPDAILRGLHRSLVGRVVSMVRNVGIVAPLMLSGGVARNEAVRKMIAEATAEDVILPRDPQLMGAYGAALLGVAA